MGCNHATQFQFDAFKGTLNLLGNLLSCVGYATMTQQYCIWLRPECIKVDAYSSQNRALLDATSKL